MPMPAGASVNKCSEFIRGWRAAVLATTPEDDAQASRQFDQLLAVRSDAVPCTVADARAVELLFKIVNLSGHTLDWKEPAVA